MRVGLAIVMSVWEVTVESVPQVGLGSLTAGPGTSKAGRRTLAAVRGTVAAVRGTVAGGCHGFGGGSQYPTVRITVRRPRSRWTSSSTFFSFFSTLAL